MRIRRLASKILGSTSCIPCQSPAAAVAAHVSAGYVCELNRSPWDVFVYPSPPSTPPPPPADEIEEGTMGDKMGGEEATSMVTSTGMPELCVRAATPEKSSKKQEKNDNKRKLPAKIAKKAKESATGAVSTTDLISNMVGMPAVRPESNGMQEERHTKPKPARKKIEMPYGKIRTMVKKIDYVESNGPFTFKKTDGKQGKWQCKRPAGQPNSVCNYHIIQHRSYNNKKVKAPAVVTPCNQTPGQPNFCCNYHIIQHQSYSNKKVKAPAVVTPCNQTKRNTSTIPTVEGISSYAALGPWRGTGQGRQDIDSIRSVAMEAITEQSKTNAILEGDIGNVVATTEQSKNEDILECDISNVEATTEQSKTDDILEGDIGNVEAPTEQSKNEDIFECDMSNVEATAEQSKTDDILEGDIGNVEATTEQSKNEDILECDTSNVEATAEQLRTEDILECDISNVEAITELECDISNVEGTTEQLRTRDILECDISNVVATTEQSRTEDILECDISNVKVTIEQSKTEDILECDISNVTHEEDSLEVSDEEEKPKRKNANTVSRKRKWRRKPVKVRSLESLM